MLQQTTVKSAIPYYEQFLQRFPTMVDLAGAPLDSVLGCWSGLGYYSRARNLHAAAVRIVREHCGIFPRDLDQAIELPGVGPYTAAAVLSISYGSKLAVIDGNVKRVLARFHAVRGSMRSAAVLKRLEFLAGELLDPDAPGEFNQAVMELGAMVCTPRSPDCAVCPVADGCGARRLGIAELLPEPGTAMPVRNESMAIAVIEKNGAVLLQKRPDNAGPLSGLWELPNILITAPTSSMERRRQALEKSLRLNVHRTVLVTDYAGEDRHAILNRRIRLFIFRAWLSRSFRPAGNRRWIDVNETGIVGTSSIVRKSLQACGLLAPTESTV